MPSVSKKQHNFMAAVAKNPKFAKKAGVPQSVGKEFLEADKGKTFRQGGLGTSTRAKMNRPRTNHGMMQFPNYGPKQSVSKKEGGVLTNNEKEKNMKHSDIKMDKKVVKKAVGMHDKQMHGGKKTDLAGLKKGGMAVKKMARGGGVEIKGKTKGTMIKMKKGGSC
jgi:hypothetical protein